MADLPDYEAALRRALEGLVAIERTERLALERCPGRVLRETVHADRDLPPFDRAQMDGYALRASEVGALDAWPVVRTIPAGSPPGPVVPPGVCVAIATGAPLPPGVDTVIQHERSDRGDPVRFDMTTIDPGRAVHPRGADAAAGDVLLEPGVIVRAHHLGIAASVGRSELTVGEAPHAIVLASGDELVPIDTEPLPHQIRNSNAPQITALLRAMGVGTAVSRHVPDQLDATVDAVGVALGEADLVVTIGGVSAGDRDHFPAAFTRHRVGELVTGARIQPGRPIRVGRDPRGTVVVALPGNPVSALACSCLFAWPIVRRLAGADPALPWRTVTLEEAVRPNPGRRAFRPACLVGSSGVVVPAWAGSGDLCHTAPTDGLLELPVQPDAVDPGSRLRFLPWPE